jgi:hypothetical protein
MIIIVTIASIFTIGILCLAICLLLPVLVVTHVAKKARETKAEREVECRRFTYAEADRVLRAVPCEWRLSPSMEDQNKDYDHVWLERDITSAGPAP